MEYSLLWKGRLWKVMVPADSVDESEVERWHYVQAYVVSGGNHGEAMRAVFRTRYPGIGWSGFKESVIPFGSFGFCGPVVSSDKSSPVSSSHSHSQMRRPPSSGRPAKDAVSDTGDRRKPVPQRATSNGALPHVPGRVAGPPSVKTKMTATPRMAGWMGSVPTSA